MIRAAHDQHDRPDRDYQEGRERNHAPARSATPRRGARTIPRCESVFHVRPNPRHIQDDTNRGCLHLHRAAGHVSTRDTPEPAARREHSKARRD
jgi:hypothetical protein